MFLLFRYLIWIIIHSNKPKSSYFLLSCYLLETVMGIFGSIFYVRLSIRKIEVILPFYKSSITLQFNNFKILRYLTKIVFFR